MWSFPSAACLGPNPDTLETEKNQKQTKNHGRVERKKTQRKIDYEQYPMQAINCYYSHVGINYV